MGLRNTKLNSANCPILIFAIQATNRMFKAFSGLNGCHQARCPNIVTIRFMLYASTCKLISALTRSRVLVRKCVDPIQDLMVPKGCSTVWRRMRIASGVWSKRRCTVSRTSSCSQRDIRRHPLGVHCALTAQVLQLELQ